MNWKPYWLCEMCDAAWRGRRKWIVLAANGLLAALMLLLGGAAGTALFCVLLLADAAIALYALHLHHDFGADYQRQPCPQDAQCETVLIDAALIGEGTRLRAAAQPFDAAEALSLRLGSGALLLGTAMTLTADELPPADRAAMLSAVQHLNIKPDRMRSHSPVLRREMCGEVICVTVRDGVQERAYFLGGAEDVSALCPRVWEGHARPMTAQDAARVADSARYIAQGGCRVLAYATALADETPVFLGLCGVGESVRLHAVQDVSALRANGLTVMLAQGDQPETDLAALRALLELPEQHARADIHLTTAPTPERGTLGITCRADGSLTEPVLQLRHRFRMLERTLRRFAALLGLTLAVALLFASWHGALVAAAVMLYASIALGVAWDQPQPRWWMLLTVALLGAVAKAFLLTQPHQASQLGGGILIALTALASAGALSAQGIPVQRKDWQRVLIPVIGAAVYVLILLVTALVQGAPILLPMAFSLLLGAVMALLLYGEHKMFR